MLNITHIPNYNTIGLLSTPFIYRNYKVGQTWPFTNLRLINLRLLQGGTESPHAACNNKGSSI